MTQRREMRDGVREAGRNVRGLGVFRLVKRCVCTFFLFFFFLNFGLTRPFRPIQADMDRVGPILAESAPIPAESGPTSAASTRVGPIRDLPRGTTRHDVAGTCGLRRPSRVAASRRVRRGCTGLGAASVHPSAPPTKTEQLSINYAYHYILKL